MNELAGKTALVSGGSRGIGDAIVRDLAGRGVQVAFSYKSSEDRAMDLVRRLQEEGQHALAIQADISDPDSVKHFAKTAVDTYGPLDFLINNAGIVQSASLAFMSDSAWNDVLETNLSGMFYLTRLAVQYLLKQKTPGSIVNVSSLSGLMGMMGQVNYAASKAGMIGFTQSLAKELAPRGIRVNVVAPGFIETDMTHRIPDDQMALFMQNIPMQRVGKPEEVAKVVSFLLSEDASYMTGSVIRIDGGYGA